MVEFSEKRSPRVSVYFGVVKKQKQTRDFKRLEKSPSWTCCLASAWLLRAGSLPRGSPLQEVGLALHFALWIPGNKPSA